MGIESDPSVWFSPKKKPWEPWWVNYDLLKTLGQATWPEESLCQEWAQTLNDLELPRFTRRWWKGGYGWIAWLVNQMDQQGIADYTTQLYI